MPSFLIKGKKYRYSGKSIYKKFRGDSEEWELFNIPFRKRHVDCDNDKLNIPKYDSEEILWEFHSSGTRKNYEYVCFESDTKRIMAVLLERNKEFIVYSDSREFYVVSCIEGQICVETKKFICCHSESSAPNMFREFRDNPYNFQTGEILYKTFVENYNDFITNKYH